jgi:hypothetical protein
MAHTIYANNDVEITVERVDAWEGKVNVNGKNLIWISITEAEKFQTELTNLLDKYRI